MEWELSGDRPIYLQISEQIKLRIVSGLYPAGAKLPSVRDMASEAAVNPNTMQRALSDLEREGLIYTERTSGRYVTEDKEMIQKTKKGLAKEVVAGFFAKMEQLGYLKDEAILMVKQGVENHE